MSCPTTLFPLAKEEMARAGAQVAIASPPPAGGPRSGGPSLLRPDGSGRRTATQERLVSEEGRRRPPIVNGVRSLRQHQVPAKGELLAYLHNRQTAGLEFRHQHPVEPYISDLCYASCCLVVEIAGDARALAAGHGWERTVGLNGRDSGVVRFTHRSRHICVFGGADGGYPGCE